MNGLAEERARAGASNYFLQHWHAAEDALRSRILFERAGEVPIRDP
jgi:hypothetical protein